MRTTGVKGGGGLDDPRSRRGGQAPQRGGGVEIIVGQMFRVAGKSVGQRKPPKQRGGGPNKTVGQKSRSGDTARAARARRMVQVCVWRYECEWGEQT